MVARDAPGALFVDLLQPDLARELTAKPERLRDLICSTPVCFDPCGRAVSSIA